LSGKVTGRPRPRPSPDKDPGGAALETPAGAGTTAGNRSSCQMIRFE
jgi:hypothetical protein